jgi:hypothetical protein
MNDDKALSRTEMIAKLAAAPIAIGAFATLCAQAEAAATIDKKTADYQTHPNGGKQCSGCVQFISPSSCKLVKGTISPTGYCKFFAAKSK